MADIRTTNIDTINSADSGYDIVIVCTGNEKQAEYWQQRLESVRGAAVRAGSVAAALRETARDANTGDQLEMHGRAALARALIVAAPVPDEVAAALCEGYEQLCDARDAQLMPWVRRFQPCDLYSKTDELGERAELVERYRELVERWLPAPLAW